MLVFLNPPPLRSLTHFPPHVFPVQPLVDSLKAAPSEEGAKRIEWVSLVVVDVAIMSVAISFCGIHRIASMLVFLEACEPETPTLVATSRFVCCSLRFCFSLHLLLAFSSSSRLAHLWMMSTMGAFRSSDSSLAACSRSFVCASPTPLVTVVSQSSSSSSTPPPLTIPRKPPSRLRML